MKELFKSLWFRLLGKQADAIVVSFATGSVERVLAMVEDARRIIPERDHVLVTTRELPPIEGVRTVMLNPGSAISLWKQLRLAFREFRIGMAPVLFDGDRGHAALRLAAFLRAPGKILAYHANLDCHHLQWRTAIASWLFWRGVALDRIHLRPGWLRWTTRERSTVPDDPVVLHGRQPRRGRRRIGVLTPFAPYPLSHGGAVRLFYLLRELAVEFDVFLFAFREADRIEELRALAEFCTVIGLVSKPRYREPRWSTLLPPEVHEYESPTMRAFVDRLCSEHHIEILQVEYTQLARYGGIVLVEHDVTFDLYKQLYERRRTLSSLWDWWRWQRFEKRIVKSYARVVTMSEKDARLLAIPHARVIPNGVDLQRFRPSLEPAGARLLFIGSFRHFPNVMAFQFLIREVWPVARAAMPELTLTVVAGPDPDPHWEAATGEPAVPSIDGITMLPFVADVRPLYESANLVLVPTLVSAGTNVKVLEAMAMERAVLSTSSGCGGIPVEHGRHVWIADGAKPFADGIVHLLSSGGLRSALAREARLLVEQQFDWVRLGEMQRSLIRELMPDQIIVRPGTAEDLARARQIQMMALPTSRWDPEHYMQHEFYVVSYAGRVAGFIVARDTAPDEREILNIGVAPDHRRLGLGELLLLRLINSGKEGEVFLEVRESNYVARRLYERVGFADVGRRPGYYEDPPETAVIMRIRSGEALSSVVDSAQGKIRI